MAEQGASTAAPAVLFDTDVLIWFFRGSEKARSFFERVPQHRRALSFLTLMELVQGCRGRDEIAQVRGFANANVALLLHPTESICRRALDLLARHAASHGLRVVDALIAATALEAGARLATANVEHYRAIAHLSVLGFTP